MADAAFDPSLDPNAAGGSFLNPAYATPAQRAQLYEYSKALMAPQPINNGWQGLASIARALIGGYEGHQADIAEQAAGRMNIAQATPGYGPSAPSPAAPSSAPQPVASAPTVPPLVAAANLSAGPYGLPAGVAPNVGGGSPANTSLGVANNNPGNIRDGDFAAKQPGYAGSNHGFAVFDSPEHGMAAADHNLAAYGAQGINTPIAIASKWAPKGDGKNDPTIYAAHVASTLGIKPTDPINMSDPNARSALAHAMFQQEGTATGPFGGGGAASAYAAPPGVPPAHAALAAGLLGRPSVPGGVQTAQNLPYSPSQLGYMLGSPNANDHMREVAARAAIPGTVTDATGNLRPVYQNSEVGPSIAGLGVPGPVIGGVAPSFVGGTPSAPTQTVANPALAGGINRGNNAGPTATPNLVGPGSLAGDVATQQGMTTANIDAQKAKSAAAQQRYQQTQTAGPALMTQAYPLRQVQAILDKNGGNIPTGEGAERVQGAASLVNMVATALGHPLTNEDSRLTSMELLHKYGTQVAASQAEALGLPHTNMGQETATGVAPGTGLSQPADAHLVDNLIRLNAVAQKKNQFEHDYYLHNQGRPDAYDNFTQDWQNEISGAKAIPLSKFGRDVIMKNGKPGVWVPSTDPSGFSLFPKDDPAFNVSAMTPGPR